MKHLGVMGGLVADEKQDQLCEIANGRPIQLADPVYNLPDAGASMVPPCPPFDEWKKETAEVLKDYAVKLGDGPFFAGAAPGYAECFVWHNLDNCFGIPGLKEMVDKADLAKLEAFYAAFAALDGVKDYLAKRSTTWGMPGSYAQAAEIR